MHRLMLTGKNALILKFFRAVMQVSPRRVHASFSRSECYAVYVDGAMVLNIYSCVSP